jgi:hypothetical protein
LPAKHVAGAPFVGAAVFGGDFALRQVSPSELVLGKGKRATLLLLS